MTIVKKMSYLRYYYFDGDASDTNVEAVQRKEDGVTRRWSLVNCQVRSMTWYLSIVRPGEASSILKTIFWCVEPAR